MKKDLPGESVCSKTVIAVKAHPGCCKLLGDNQTNKNPILMVTKIKPKEICHRHGLDKFDRFIIVIRNLYNAVWSEYQRKTSNGGGHNHGILRDSFKTEHWTKYAIENAEIIAKHLQLFHQIYIQSAVSDHNSIFLRYEEIQNPVIRINQMKKMLSFIPFNISEERLHCAFVLSDNPNIHRHIDNRMFTINEAYASDEFVCKLWSIWTSLTSFIVQQGYRPWRGIECKI